MTLPTLIYNIKQQNKAINVYIANKISKHIRECIKSLLRVGHNTLSSTFTTIPYTTNKIQTAAMK